MTGPVVCRMGLELPDDRRVCHLPFRPRDLMLHSLMFAFALLSVRIVQEGEVRHRERKLPMIRVKSRILRANNPGLCSHTALEWVAVRCGPDGPERLDQQCAVEAMVLDGRRSEMVMGKYRPNRPIFASLRRLGRLTPDAAFRFTYSIIFH